MISTKEQSRPAAARSSLRHWLLLVTLLVASAIVSVGVLTLFRIHIEQVRGEIREQNNIRMAALAERVQAQLESVYLHLTSLACNEHIRTMSSSTTQPAGELFDLWLNKWLVSALYVAPFGFDGTGPPLFARPPWGVEGNGDPEQDRVSALLAGHIRWFGENPSSKAQINGIASEEAAGENRLNGLLYSVPVVNDGKLAGIVSAIIPVSRISYLLEMGTVHNMALLTNENGLLLRCADFPADTLEWFRSSIDRNGIIPFFENCETSFVVDKWTTLWTNISSPYGRRDRWWLVFQYDERAFLDEIDAPGPATAYTAAALTGIIGLFLSLLIFLIQKATSDRNETERIFADIARRILGKSREEFFQGLAQGIAAAFNVKYVLVGETVRPSDTEVVSLAFFGDGKMLPGIRYPLEGTPCADLANKGPGFYPRNAARTFPQDNLLAEMGIESYFGLPLFSKERRPVGILAILDTKPMHRSHPHHAQVLELLAERAAAELERARAEEALQALVSSTTFIGKECFSNAATALAHWLCTESVLIGEFTPEGKVKTVVAEIDGKRVVDFSYELAGSPCAEVANRGFCIYADDVASLFPADERLKTLEARGYVGIPLRAQNGKAIGVLCCISRTRLILPPSGREVFSILAARLSSELERLAAERREKVLAAQLRQAQKMEAVGRLAGGIAHDFNNLLQAIQGYGLLASERLPDDHKAREELGEVLKAAERAAALVRQLLTFSRRSVSCAESVNLNKVILNILKLITRVLGEHIETTFIPGENLSHIHADIAQLEQVLMNLCVNARDAMPSGGKLTIETKNETLDADFCSNHPWAREGDYVRLNVTDTGAGIPRDLIEHIFEPFFTTKGIGEGTGLGLATVYGIVDQHKGMIRVYSEEDHGTAFHIYFPAGSATENALAADRDESSQGGSETILYAEDEEAVRKLVLSVLGDAGYQVVFAANGEEAIDLARRHKGQFALAILDVVMPLKGGKAVAEFLRAQWPDIPILFCSGYSDQHLTPNLFGDEKVAMIEKPFAPTALLRKIREMVGS